jgi:hypothetical protein
MNFRFKYQFHITIDLGMKCVTKLQVCDAFRQNSVWHKHTHKNLNVVLDRFNQ